jgi:hypothetical protein
MGIVKISPVKKFYKYMSSNTTKKKYVDEFYLLGHNAVQSVESEPTFRRNMLPPSAGSKNKPRALLATSITLISFLAYSFTLKMEAACSSETSVDTQRTTRRYIPEDRTLHNHRYENLKSYKKRVIRIYLF